MSFSEEFNALLEKYINENKDNFNQIDPSIMVLTSETIGEVIEKLLILNIRIWQLEDQASLAKQANDMTTYATLKNKLDTCFKVRRPALVSVLDAMLNKTISEDAANIKIYK